MLWQPSLPDVYTKMPADLLAQAITQRRKELGDQLVILGHHYQTDEVIQHADYTGDSLKLSQIAARLSGERGPTNPVKYVVFCGVHFMAETADMLTPAEVAVILPDLSAGCSMADMAQYDDTVQAWNDIHAALREQGWNGKIVPITYVNSSAAIKAFVGEHGGACCTSSNAREVFAWAMSQTGGPPLRGGRVPKTFGLQNVPPQLDTIETPHRDIPHDTIRLKPIGFTPRDPFPEGQASPRDLQRDKRDLPHLQLHDATYFVTWKTHQDRALSDAEMKATLDALTHWDDKKCRVYAACVMNTHVHWIVRPHAKEDLGELVTSVKRFSAKTINQLRGEQGHVWDDERFDHIIRNETTFTEKVLYTIRNPVAAGFCQAPSMYPWTRVHSDVGWSDDSGGNTAAPEGRPTTDVRVLFLPDQHLGRNTAHRFGIDVARQSCVYDPRLTRRGQELGGATREQLLASKVILWAGHCSVHKLFRPEHCDAIRSENAELAAGQEPTTILVHPECCKEVVDKSDLNGSTEFIIKTIREAKAGSRWAVGTEVHLVNRIAKEAQGRGVHVRILSDCQCLCTTMFRIDQPHLLWVLDNLAGKCEERTGSGKPAKARIVNQIEVLPTVRELALLAIDRMLQLGPGASAGGDGTHKHEQRLERLGTAD